MNGQLFRGRDSDPRTLGETEKVTLEAKKRLWYNSVLMEKRVALASIKENNDFALSKVEVNIMVSPFYRLI